MKNIYNEMVFEGVPRKQREEILNYIKNRYEENKIISPYIEDVFKSYEMIALEDVDFMLMGKDPFKSSDLATGNAFSVKEGVYETPEYILKKICENLPEDYLGELGISKRKTVNFNKVISTDLDYLNQQGVLLTNLALTLRNNAKRKNTEKDLRIWYENFTKFKLEKLLSSDKPFASIVCGREANEYLNMFLENHKLRDDKLIIQASHPASNGKLKNLNCGIQSFDSTDFSVLHEFMYEHLGRYIDFTKSFETKNVRTRK